MIILYILVTILIIVVYHSLMYKRIDRIETIDVVIPIFPRDFHYLTNIVEQINNQSMKPQTLIIAASECSDDMADELLQMMESVWDGSYTIQIVPTMEKQYAGPNRNRGIDASTSTYVAFTDADDVMHKDWIKITHDTFILHDSNIVVHSYLLKVDEEWNDRSYNVYNTPSQKGKKLYKNTLKSDKSKELQLVKKGIPSNGKIHHGHPAVNRKALKDLRYSDERRGQDVLFLRQCMKHFGNSDKTITWIDAPLTYYLPSDHEDNDAYSERK